MQNAMILDESAISEAISMSSCEQSELFIYRFTCPLKPIVDENRNGCGWDHTKDEDEISQAMGLLDQREALKKIRETVAQLDGQELATHCDDENVLAIDVVSPSIQEAQFFVHFMSQPTPADLEAFKQDLVGQLSDGFGEVLEQTDMGLNVSPDSFYASRSGDDVEWNVMFGFDYDRLSGPQAYDPKTMYSLDEIDSFKSAHKLTGSRP